MRAITRRRLRAAYRDLPAITVFLLAVVLIYSGSRLLLGWWLP